MKEVGTARLELATLRSQSVRSSHLNYVPKMTLIVSVLRSFV